MRSMRASGAVVTVALSILASRSAVAGGVAGTVTVRSESGAPADRAGVVVYLDGARAPGRPPAETRQIRQREQQFAPALTVAVVDSTVEFPNDDKIFHNVFSLSAPARFDLGLYKSGTSKSVNLKRPGVVDVYCNIHPNMVAKIVVIDSDYHAVTGADGRFQIDGVPPGRYSLVAWQRSGEPYRGQVKVASGTSRLDIQLTAGKPARKHLRKDGTPYGRYK